LSKSDLVSSPNFEPGEPGRLLCDDVDPVDASTARALAHEGDELLDRLALALEDGFDRPVGLIPHPARHPFGERAAPRRLAEEDSLHLALHDDAATLHGF